LWKLAILSFCFPISLPAQRPTCCNNCQWYVDEPEAVAPAPPVSPLPFRSWVTPRLLTSISSSPTNETWSDSVLGLKSRRDTLQQYGSRSLSRIVCLCDPLSPPISSLRTASVDAPCFPKERPFLPSAGGAPKAFCASAGLGPFSDTRYLSPCFTAVFLPMS